PVWSPDGTKIAFTSNRDANDEIYVMNADGSSQTRFTAAAGDDTTADWQAIPKVPPPPTALSSAVLTSRWRESAYLGSLVIRGSVPGPARFRLVLRRRNAVAFTALVTVGTGSFERVFRLRHDLLPGAYVLEVTPSASPTPLTAQVLSPALRAPPEGVVSRAWVSDVVNGTPVDRFPPRTTRVWAQFQFAARPRSGRLTATWYGPGFVPKPKSKPKTPLVVSWLDSRNDVPFYRGAYSCVLRAGATVVKRVRFRVG